MAEFFVGEIRLFGFGFAPKYWALCNGQLLPINQNMALFSLLGITYGGNGVNTFALPDLRGRVPVGQGSNPTSGALSTQLGEVGGQESVMLLSSQMPSHVHAVNVAGSATTGQPGGAVVLASTPASKPYRSSPGTLVPLDADSVRLSGGSQPHPNLQPHQVVNFAIALQGIFPSRN